MSSYQVANIVAMGTKRSQGYIAAHLRQTCITCKHCEPKKQTRSYQMTQYRCKFGNFDTTANAICDKHETKNEVPHEKL